MPGQPGTSWGSWPASVRTRTSRYRVVVNLTDFLLERCREMLDQESCRYEIGDQGRVDCLCEDPSEDATTLLNRVNFILWLSELDMIGEVFFRLLADAHLDPPDYRTEWRRLG